MFGLVWSMSKTEKYTSAIEFATTSIISQEFFRYNKIIYCDQDGNLFEPDKNMWICHTTNYVAYLVFTFSQMRLRQYLCNFFSKTNHLPRNI